PFRVFTATPVGVECGRLTASSSRTINPFERARWPLRGYTTLQEFKMVSGFRGSLGSVLYPAPRLEKINVTVSYITFVK
ncbi:hypothetical protein, partial [Palaeococcus sp. (in: euryarchaeotes)]